MDETLYNGILAALEAVHGGQTANEVRESCWVSKIVAIYWGQDGRVVFVCVQFVSPRRREATTYPMQHYHHSVST